MQFSGGCVSVLKSKIIMNFDVEFKLHSIMVTFSALIFFMTYHIAMYFRKSHKTAGADVNMKSLAHFLNTIEDALSNRVSISSIR